MNIVFTMIRLRWSLTFGVMRKSVWQTVGFIIGLVMALGTVVAVGAGAWFAGGAGAELIIAEGGSVIEYFLGLQAFAVIGGTFATIIVLFVQMMIIGDGTSMGSRRFSLYGIKDRTLHAGLIMSTLCGLPALAGTASLMLLSMAYRWVGPVMVVTAIIAAPLAIITMVSMSKALMALITTLVNSRRGKTLFYLVVMVLFIVLMQLPNIIVNSNVDAQGNTVNISLSQMMPSIRLAAWTPLGAAFQLPFDAAQGDWLLALARLAILAVTWIVCFAAGTWSLRHDRLHMGESGTSGSLKGVGAFAWMPDSVSGAISARYLTYLKRDPRQGIMFLMPLLFFVIFTIQGNSFDNMPFYPWLGVIIGGIFLSAAEANGLAYDGRGFTMQVLTGAPGSADRLGRVRVLGTISCVYISILAVAAILVSGTWHTPGDLSISAAFYGGALALGLGALGLAEIFSCVLMYPTPSIDKPFSTPQGRAIAQGFIPLLFMLGSCLTVLPTGIVALVLALTDQSATMMWVLLPVGVLNGAGMLALGTWIGGIVLDKRAVRIIATLDNFAALQK